MNGGNVAAPAGGEPNVRPGEIAFCRVHFDAAARFKDPIQTLPKHHVVPRKAILVIKHQRMRHKLLASDLAVKENGHGAVHHEIPRFRVEIGVTE